MFWPFTAWIDCSSDLKNFAKFSAFSLESQKFFSISRFFFLTVDQNNFDNKILIFAFFRYISTNINNGIDNEGFNYENADTRSAYTANTEFSDIEEDIKKKKKKKRTKIRTNPHVSTLEKKAKKKKAKDKDKKSEENSEENYKNFAVDNVDQDIPYIDEQPDATLEKESKDSDKEPKNSDSEGQESDDNCSYDSNENDENDNKADEIGNSVCHWRIPIATKILIGFI